MNNNQLYTQLKEAYCDKNLNKISAQIIDLYKTGQHVAIKEMAELIEDYVKIPTTKISRCFTKLISLYHPDKSAYFLSEIENNYRQRNKKAQEKLAHIFLIKNFQYNDFGNAYNEDIDFNPEYVWEDIKDGFRYFSGGNEDSLQDEYYLNRQSEDENDFFSAVKRKLYGVQQIDLPLHYLEDFEDIDMAEYEINKLDGIQYCKHARVLDLSYNEITEINLIGDLKRIEELYLAENRILYVDALHYLKNLRILDLANNDITDLSPLMNLEALNFLNIMGNPVPAYQINQLKDKGVAVVC